MEPSNAPNRIFGLDLMRAAAILLVLAGHCAWIFPAGNNIFTALMALSGFLGVEIFFVLSGFLIGRILFRAYTKRDFGVSGLLHFLKRRWWRTLPNYALVLTLNLIVAFFLSIPYRDIWQYFFFLQNFAWPLKPFFTESWSLSVEEFAYLILPAMLLLPGSRNKSRRFLGAAIALVLIFIAAKIAYHLAHSATSMDDWNIGLKSVVIYRLDSIFIGVVAGWLQLHYPAGWRKTRLFWLLPGVALLLFYTFGVGWLGLLIGRAPFFWNVVYLPLASVTAAFFLPWLSEWKMSSGPIARAVTFISVISYSIYLLHYGIVLQLMKHAVDTRSLSAVQSMLFTLIYFAITVALSAFLYRFYEKPMMDKREKWSGET
jgi:peptidoglycan/LPS O-acetylase OafA/YrhL